jgi:hypothetical protein
MVVNIARGGCRDEPHLPHRMFAKELRVLIACIEGALECGGAETSGRVDTLTQPYGAHLPHDVVNRTSDDIGDQET